jgi:uncharacterized Tic20 family protein
MPKPNKLHKLLVVPVVLLIVLLTTTTALAAFTTVQDFEVWDWNYHVSSPDRIADWTNGVGWTGGVVYITAGGAYYNNVSIAVDFDEARFTSISTTVDVTKGTGATGGKYAFGLYCVRLGSTNGSYTRTFDQVSNGTNTFTLTGTRYCDQIMISLHVSRSSDPELADSGVGIIQSVTVISTNEEDEDPFDGWTPGEIGGGPYKPLPLTLTYEVNHVTGSGPVVDDVWTELGTDVFNSIEGQVVLVSQESSGYTVKVRSPDDRYTIYSNMASVYPQLNDYIEAGCVLGKTGTQIKEPSQTYTQNPGLLWYYAGTDFYDFASNLYIDWQTEFDEPPVAHVPCGDNLRTDNCLNYNPGLDDKAAGWTPLYIDDYDLGDTEVKLSTHSASLSQYMVLDHTEDYYVTLKTKQYASSYDYISVVVTKATSLDIIDSHTVVTQTDNPGDPLITEVGPLDLTDWDENDSYIVSLYAANPYTNGVWITDACLHTGDAVVTQSACYFTNYDLDDSTGWDSDAGADWDLDPDTFGAGVVLSPGEWISQAMTLQPYSTADADYYLTISAKVTGADLGDIIDIFTAGWTGDLNQEVKSGETVLLDIGDTTVNNLFLTMDQVTEFTVAAELSGDLVITSDAANTKNLYIDSVCIEPVTGVWPGTEDADIITDTVEVCDACAMPTGLNIQALGLWLVWLWCEFNRFLTCTLAKWIAAIVAWLQQLRDLIGYLGRYFAVIIGQFVNWLLALVEAFGIALKNALLYILSLAWNFIAGLDFIQLLLDLIGYAIAILTGLVASVSAAFELIISFFNILLGIGHLIEQFVAGLSAALSGDVQTIVLPSCDPPASALISGFCVPLDIGAGIFSEFPALSASMVLYAGLFGLVTIVWTVRNLGEAVGNVA